MKYYFDTEFIENGKTIDLISIGVVCEDGRKYYAISNEYDASEASDWVVENVINRLHPSGALRTTRAQIRKEIVKLIGDDKPEFWAYYASYDWVVFCQLFGTMMDLPKGYPMFCNDIKQLCNSLGNPRLPRQETGNHNALADAEHNKTMYDFLTKEHYTDCENCWCQPAIEEHEGGNVIIHNRPN